MKYVKALLLVVLCAAASGAHADMLLTGVGSAGLPLNFLPPAFAAYSTRLLRIGYTGKAVNIRRASDSTTTDIGFAGGNLDATAFNIFCAATTCFVTKWYDQSGNGRDASQGTAANQPQIFLMLAALNNRPAVLFGDASAFELDTTSTAASIFGAGGFYSSVIDSNAAPSSSNRFFSHGSVTLFVISSGSVQFQQVATTTGAWLSPTSTLPASGAHVVDLLYSSAALANVPVLALDGTNKSLTPTQPTGSITPESGAISVGNVNNNRGFPGYMAEDLFFANQPSAAQIAVLRANQKAYWGTP